MRYLLLFIFVVLSVQRTVFSNPLPVDPYTQLAITEVAIDSPYDWQIEIDGRVCLYDYSVSSFPCTTSLFLRIGSKTESKGIYHVNVAFGYNQYGVITSRSLEPEQRSVALTWDDTIMVTCDSIPQTLPDFVKFYSEYHYWVFPLHPVPTGHVLIQNQYSDIIDGQKPLATTRRSIGSAGMYTTRHRITLLDSRNNPLPYIVIHGTGRNESDSTGTFEVTTSLFRPACTLSFYDYSALHNILTGPIPDLPVSYLDTDTLREDTLRFNMVQYRLTVEDTAHRSVQEVECFNPIHQTADIHPSDEFRKIYPVTDTPVTTWLLNVYESQPVETLFVAQGVPSDTNPYIAAWYPSYVDTSAIIDHTITIVPVATHRFCTRSFVSSAISFSIVPAGSHGLKLIYTSPNPFTFGVFSLYTVAGRKIMTMRFRNKREGTNTIPIAFTRRILGAGKYIGRLDVDDHTPVTQVITIANSILQK